MATTCQFQYAGLPKRRGRKKKKWSSSIRTVTVFMHPNTQLPHNGRSRDKEGRTGWIIISLVCLDAFLAKRAVFIVHAGIITAFPCQVIAVVISGKEASACVSIFAIGFLWVFLFLSIAAFERVFFPTAWQSFAAA